jgi:hypothetical protein
MIKTNGKANMNGRKDAVVAWSPIAHVIQAPSNEEEYDSLVSVLDFLLDNFDVNEDTPASSLIHMIGTLIESYDNIHFNEFGKMPIKPPIKSKARPQLRTTRKFA